jgi:hypothetical protein
MVDISYDLSDLIRAKKTTCIRACEAKPTQGGASSQERHQQGERSATGPGTGSATVTSFSSPSLVLHSTLHRGLLTGVSGSIGEAM